jgi:hypothetical protein
MNNNPLSSFIADSSDRLFVTDKSGKIVFFPWGSNKQGYYIKNRNLATKVKKFYKTSFFVCLVLLIIPLSFFNKNFWGIVCSMVVCFGGWYLAYFLYVSKVVKSLQPAKANYTELILAKYESADTESEDLEGQIETQFPAQWSKPISQTNNDPFLGVKRIWYRLSPGQLFFLLFSFGGGIIMVSANFIKHEFGKSPIDFLIAFVVSVIWGFAGFIVAQNMEGDKKDWWGFLNWKLPMILITVACWSFAVYSLYKFFFMVFV